MNASTQKQASLKKAPSFLVDLSNKKLNSIFGREKEIEKVIEVLGRKNKSNPILVGEAGVGKTSIVEGLVNKIQQGDVPENLLNKKVYSLDLSALCCDLSYFKAIIQEAVDTKAILFIDEIHNIVGAGRNFGNLDVANLLKPILTDGSISCIGATTYEEYHQCFEKDAALERRFSKIVVEELSIKDTFREDFPYRDDKNWLAWTNIQKDSQGNMTVSKVPIPDRMKTNSSMTYRQRYPIIYAGEAEIIKELGLG